MLNYKSIYKVFAVIFAFLLTIYPLSPMFYEPVKAIDKQTPALTEQKSDNNEQITENQQIDDISVENTEPYTKLSARARKSAKADNFPLAGYEVDETNETSVKPVTLKDKFLAEIENLKKSGYKKTNSPKKSVSGKTPTVKNSPNRFTDEEWENSVTVVNDYNNNPVNNFDATYDSEIKENNDTNYHITRTHDFGIKYTVTFNTGKYVDVGDAVIRIPSEIFRDRNNQPISIRSEDGIALPLYIDNPTKNEQTGDYTPLYNVSPNSIVKSNRTQFGYFIETDENGKEYYVIVNYDPIRPGTNWFEIVYDEINVFDVTDGVSDGNITEDTENTWTIEPHIDVQYKYEIQRYVLGGFTANLDHESATLQPIMLDWKDYLPDGYADPRFVYVGSNNEVYYIQTENDIAYLYKKNSDGTASQEYMITSDSPPGMMKKDENGNFTISVPENEAPIPSCDTADVPGYLIKDCFSDIMYW